MILQLVNCNITYYFRCYDEVSVAVTPLRFGQGKSWSTCAYLGEGVNTNYTPSHGGSAVDSEYHFEYLADEIAR